MKVFADRHDLVQHKKSRKHQNSPCAPIQRVSGRQLFECDAPKCGATFPAIGALNKHKERVHEKPFGCRFRAICNKRFGTPQRAAIHQRIHSGKRTEHCRLCEATFVDPGTLRQHLVNVHGEGPAMRPFVCRLCHKRFTKRSLLKMHLKRHLDNGRRGDFECKICGKDFNVKSNLSRHLKRMHRDRVKE